MVHQLNENFMTFFICCDFLGHLGFGRIVNAAYADGLLGVMVNMDVRLSSREIYGRLITQHEINTPLFIFQDVCNG